MTEKLTNYDPAKALVDDEEIAFFIADALETNDSAYIANAMGIVARAKGIVEIAKETGFSVEYIYDTLNDHGNNTIETAKLVLKFANARYAQFEQAQKRRSVNEMPVREEIGV